MDLKLSSDDNPRDYLLDLNDLGKPRVIDMSRIENGVMNTAITCIARLIIMRKGTDMDRPDMGIDIVGRYRFADTDELVVLQQEIENQIYMYLPEFIPVTVECSPVIENTQDRSIVKVEINVTIDGVMYQLMYNIEDSKIEVLQY